MGKMIVLGMDRRRSLERDFSVTRQTVWAALNYKTQGGKAKVLRAAALQRGGVNVDFDGQSTYEPTFTTTFKDAPRRMVQMFSPRVNIVCELEGRGEVAITLDGEEVINLGVLAVKDLPIAQAKAQAIVNGLK